MFHLVSRSIKSLIFQRIEAFLLPMPFQDSSLHPRFLTVFLTVYHIPSKADTVMALTNIEARTARARGKPHKLADEKGLYLLVKPTGKYWRFDYRFAGKRKTLAVGVYPEVTLAEARDKRDKARKLLADSIDPGSHRK